MAPAADSDGVYFKLCTHENKPFKICSIGSKFVDGEVEEVPLGDGECPWGRWGNSITEANRQQWKIKDEDTPTCDDQIILYCWDLDMMVPFRAYFKVMSYGYARDFLASCTRGIGEKATEYPFHAFVAHITVEDKDEYALTRIVNTGNFTVKDQIMPIVKWFDDNQGIFVRNLALQMEEARKKADKAGEFKKEDYEK
jgi:hypothetical protein